MRISLCAIPCLISLYPVLLLYRPALHFALATGPTFRTLGFSILIVNANYSVLLTRRGRMLRLPFFHQ